MGKAESPVIAWLKSHPTGAKPYTRLRIEESFEGVEGTLASYPGAKRGTLLDVGCGAGYDSFALARHFKRVVAVDADGRMIREARRVAEGAGVSNIEFLHADIEKIQTSARFDFLHCNLMSHNLRSRLGFFRRAASLLEPRGWMHYSEIVHGYPLMEARRALKSRDLKELALRAAQGLNGLVGAPGFRFFLAGTAKPALEVRGFSVAPLGGHDWNGVPFVESFACRQVDGVEGGEDGPDPDYDPMTSDFADVRAIARSAFRARPSSGFRKAYADGLFSRAASHPCPYSWLILFLLTADRIFPHVISALPSYHPMRRRFSSLRARLSSRLSRATWDALEDLDDRRLEIARKKAGMGNEPIED